MATPSPLSFQEEKQNLFFFWYFFEDMFRLHNLGFPISHREATYWLIWLIHDVSNLSTYLTYLDSRSQSTDSSWVRMSQWLILRNYDSVFLVSRLTHPEEGQSTDSSESWASFLSQSSDSSWAWVSQDSSWSKEWASFFWGGVSIGFLISWGLQLIDLLTYPGGSPNLRLTAYWKT